MIYEPRFHLEAAMGIRKKMRRRKGQIRRHYDGKNVRQKFVISGSINNATTHYK